ncbi:hypothetical protein AMR72_11690 [Flavobacterium psychrophilum]|nr:hypothetical protein AMR72_11690 [Flavobacterium psychrophilum]AOE53119.1 hypothetical protein ALW18_11680 [Flavobacterium psychrophilum]
MAAGRIKTLFVVAIVIIGLFVVAQIYSRKRGAENYTSFNSAYIDGVLEKTYFKFKGVGFTMEDGSEYVFYPYKSELNSFKNFDRFASKGDRVLKLAHSDTLFLFKEGKRYKFTFIKF